MRHLRRVTRAVAAVLLAGVAALGVTAPAATAAAAAAAGDAPADDGPPAAPVILVGVAGLRWDDVQTLSTPALWDMSRTASLGLVAARSVSSTACPADGWLAVGAGARLADLEVPDGTCRTLRDPGESGEVPGWADYVAAAADQPYGARPGLLGDAIADGGVAASAIGPGAALALADADGLPAGPAQPRPALPHDLGSAVRAALATSSLVVVDAGAIRDAGNATRSRAATTPGDTDGDAADLPGEEPSHDPSGLDVIVEPTRAEQVRLVDERVEAVLRAGRAADATVLVVSLADSGRARLQLAAAIGPSPDGGTYTGGLLTSGSTRQDGLVQTTDVTSTLLELLGLPQPPAAAGAPIVRTDGPATATERVALVQDIAVEARQVTRLASSYLTRLVMAEAVLFVAAALLLGRRAARGRADRAPLRPALRVLAVVSLALGSAPVASYLAGVVPWWRAPSPTWAFWWAVLAWMAVITAVALAGPWRRNLLGPAGVVAGVTVAVLVVDTVLGSPLFIDAPMGSHRIQAARFYGMGNQAFALVAAAGILAATAVAQPLVSRGRRRLATGLVIAIGLVVTVVDGAPGLGSDFGGPPGIILGFAVLATVVSGRRVRWKPLLLVALVAGAVVIGFAWLDWLRPPADRTHLGRFFATVVDGELWQVVSRKVAVQLRVLTYWRYLVLALGGTIVTVLVLLGPWPWRRRARRTEGDAVGALADGDGPLSGLGRAVPLLGAGIAGIAVALGIGFLINDSGIVVPATGLAVVVPCLVAAAAQLRLREGRDGAAAAARDEAAGDEAAGDDATRDETAEAATGAGAGAVSPRGPEPDAAPA